MIQQLIIDCFYAPKLKIKQVNVLNCVTSFKILTTLKIRSTISLLLLLISYVRNNVKVTFYSKQMFQLKSIYKVQSEYA